MDKYDTLEYSQVKAITVFVRLRIFLCALIITNNYLVPPPRGGYCYFEVHNELVQV
jgi:hypothetical protein